ncbi:acetyltransferase [Xylariaceae sp. AK1471]|nr:acetyltransferase [Xylariaceae sp. AK1471]
MSTTPTFHVRGLGERLKDKQFILDAFDSSLPQLAKIGSGNQWGSELFSKRPDIEDRLKIFQAKRYQETGEGDPVRIFIIEAEIPPLGADELPASGYVRTDDAGKKFLAVGSAMLSEGKYPPYVGLYADKNTVGKELSGTQDYVYLDGLITDYRTGPWRKGAGAALIEHCRQYCRERGKPILYLDGYSGNDRKLVRYYESQGFSVVDYFETPKPDGSTWPGAFLRMDVAL